MVALIQSKYQSIYWFIHSIKCFFRNQFKRFVEKLSDTVGFRIVIASTKKESKRKFLEMEAYDSEAWNKRKTINMVGDVIDERYRLFQCIKAADAGKEA